MTANACPALSLPAVLPGLPAVLPGLPAVLLAWGLALGFLVNPVEAQQDDAAQSSASAQVGDAAENASTEDKPVEEDPYALPEGANAEELFAFMRRMQLNRGRTIESVSKSAKAVVAAAVAIRELDGVSLDDELKAVREQMSTLTFLQRFDPASRQGLQDLIASLEQDTRPEFRKIGVMEGFKTKVAGARAASEPEQQQLVAELKELIGDGEFDRDAYTLAYALARSISYSDSVDLAASLYEDMAAWMSESSDESLRQRAPKMLGSARRIRLPGNKMEIVGTTTAGEPFDWDAYLGRVVLVDFWASWCGPCRAEIPNMKRNLARFGDNGFAIVGVNLDNSLEACEKYVGEQELTWTNLISDKDGERGWDNPLATYFGITAIPTAILVDQEGKVVSLNARGQELDRLLVELLGEPAPEPLASSETEPAEGDSQGKDDNE